VPARRSVRMVKLAVAVVSVINASAALAAPLKAPVRPCGAQVIASDASHREVRVRVQRPPRVPRREPYLHGEWRVGEQ
jgi:hypothetical protein